MFKHAITYSSDLIIRDSAKLTSLCVFFDNTYLPHLPSENAGSFLRVSEHGTEPDVDIVDLPSAGDYLHYWDESHGALFGRSVLKRLPAVKQSVEVDHTSLQTVLNDLYPNVSGPNVSGPCRLYFLARVVHHLRPDQKAPHLIDPICEAPTREGYKWILAHEAFSYMIPSLNALTPGQILEVRDKVADTREGFAMHLQKLSREVEQRTSAGDSIDSIKQYARSIIETDLIPDFAEFRRQLSAERMGFWAKLLDVASKGLRLLIPAARADLAGSGFTTLSAIMSLTGERREAQNTNVRLAYQFLDRVSSEGNRSRPGATDEKG